MCTYTRLGSCTVYLIHVDLVSVNYGIKVSIVYFTRIRLVSCTGTHLQYCPITSGKTRRGGWTCTASCKGRMSTRKHITPNTRRHTCRARAIEIPKRANEMVDGGVRTWYLSTGLYVCRVLYRSTTDPIVHVLRPNFDYIYSDTNRGSRCVARCVRQALASERTGLPCCCWYC